MAKAIDQSGQLHVAFFPFMAPGHTNPMLYTARMFAARGVKTTILTTPLNAPSFTEFLGINNSQIEVIPFPWEESGLPEGVENMANCTSRKMSANFVLSMQFFEEPLERFLEKTRPDCLVADPFFVFATDVAAKFSIPRIVFYPGNFYTKCEIGALRKYGLHKKLTMTEDEPFVVPNFPHEIKLPKSQLLLFGSNNHTNKTVIELGKIGNAVHEAELKSFGVCFNTFYELEPDYADYYRNSLGKKCWHIGPVSLFNIQDNNNNNEEEHECIKWLDSKEPNSIVYICFGSLHWFSASNRQEMMMALEASGQQFLWVVQKLVKEVGNEDEEWLPDEFGKRMQDKGLIIRGWAPQAMILRHPAIGGFVTHCGWNSIIESISAGVPMVTWPHYGDQFPHEKMVTEVLKIGVPIESKEDGVLLMREKIKTALERIMVGKEALEMRTRVKKLQEMAYKAMEEGGSSFNDLSSLIHELKCYQP